jgi:hypothetical protein
MANHTITAALIASVAICQLGWAKIGAANFKAAHKTTPQLSAPTTTAVAIASD